MPDQTNAKARRKKRRGKRVWILLSVVVTVVGCGVAYLWMGVDGIGPGLDGPKIRYPYDDLGLRQLLAMPPALPESGEETLTSEEYVRRNGPSLLRNREWEKAAELYGRAPQSLFDDIENALKADHLDGEDEKNCYRMDLIEAIFWHFDLGKLSWLSGGPKTALCLCKRYECTITSLPEKPARPVLDVSHLDELRKMADLLYSNTSKPTKKDGERIEATLCENPGSVPALAAYLIYLGFPGTGAREHPDLYSEAAVLELTPLLRLMLARAVTTDEYYLSALAVPLIEQGYVHAPTDEEKARLLLMSAKVVPISAADQAKAAERVLEMFPDTKAADEACSQAIDYLTRAHKPQEALAWIRDLQKKGTRPGLDRALFSTATAFYNTEDYSQSIQLLNEALALAKGTTLASRVMLGLSESHHAAGNKEQEEVWLRKCAAHEQTEATSRSLMDTDNTRSVAIQRLGKLHAEREEWAKALACWLAWKPKSWCGTCAMSMSKDRYEQIEKCRKKLKISSESLLREGAGALPLESIAPESTP